MIAYRGSIVALAAALVSLTAGCAVMSVTTRMQFVSAGYTGCLPQENDISNTTTNLNGSIIWNATCKGKTYLCSTVNSESYSCAPVAH